MNYDMISTTKPARDNTENHPINSEQHTVLYDEMEKTLKAMQGTVKGVLSDIQQIFAKS